MASRRDLAALAATAVLAFAGTGLHPRWWSAWLAPLPVLTASVRIRPRRAFVLGASAWFLGGLNLWAYFRSLLAAGDGAGPGVASALVPLAVIAVPALAFGGAAAGFAAWSARDRPWLAAALFATAWVGYEFATARLSPHGTFGNLAYSQVGFPPAVQVASLAGPWAVSLALTVSPALLAAGIARRPGGRRERTLVAASALVTLAVFGFGFWRIAPRPAAPTLRVRLAASDLPANVLPVAPADVPRLTRDYLEATRPAGESVDVLLLPEKLGVLEGDAADEVDRVLAEEAGRRGALVVAGFVRRDGLGARNAASVYRPAARAPLAYAKRHLLPGFESSLAPGTARLVVDHRAARLGVAICKDMDFPDLGRAYADDGANVLLVPAWDFDADGWLHARMAMMRGIESGFAVVRAAKQGLLTVADDRGVVLAERSSRGEPFARADAALPVRRTRTFYARTGDWLGWTCVLAATVLLAGLRRARRPTAAP